MPNPPPKRNQRRSHEKTIVLNTPNLERVCDFYADKLGIGNLASRELHVAIGSHELVFRSADSASAPVTMDIYVESIKAFEEELQKLGVEYAPDRWSPLLDGAILLKDPDQHTIRVHQQRSTQELCDWRLDSFQRESALIRRLLRREDVRTVGNAQGEIRVFAAVRNEELRLPFFLDYYRRIGATRFFIVDNASTDATASILRSAPDVHIFYTASDYYNQHLWLYALLQEFGRGYWCVPVDADELLTYPDLERRPLSRLCSEVEAAGYDAVHSLLLDLYPKSPLSKAVYTPGKDFRTVARWFDSASHVAVPWPEQYINAHQPERIHMGGVRQRIFGVSPSLSKFPLVRFRHGMLLSQGTHYIQGARVAPMLATTLHFKFLHDFSGVVHTEAARGAHFANAVEYRAYDALASETDLTLYAESSVEYESSRELIRLGLMSEF